MKDICQSYFQIKIRVCTHVVGVELRLCQFC